MTAAIADTTAVESLGQFGKLTAKVRRLLMTRSVASLADQAASSAATFLTGAIIGRTCPRAEFGLFALSLSILAWVTNLQSAFVTTPYIYGNAALSEADRRGYAGSTLLSQGVYALLATIILLATAWAVWYGGKSAEFAPILAALGAMLWFQLIKEYCRQMSFAHLRINSALWLDIVVGVLQIGGLIALAIVGGMSGVRAYWIIGVASILPSLGWLVLHRQLFTFDRFAFTPAIRRNWEFGRWLLGGYVLNAASRDGYAWLVTAVHGAAATGLLAACMGVAFLVSPIVNGISNVLAPSFAHTYANGGVSALRGVVRRMTLVALLGITVYCLMMWLIGGRVAALIYGHAFAGHGIAVTLLAISVAATVASLPLGTALYVVRRADVNFRASAIAVVVMGIAGIALVHRFGVLGAAIGLICGNTAESLYKWYRYEAVLRADAMRSDG